MVTMKSLLPSTYLGNKGTYPQLFLITFVVFILIAYKLLNEIPQRIF